MKKTYFAPDAQVIEFLTYDTMGPSYMVTPGGNSEKGDGDVTELLPIDIF